MRKTCGRRAAGFARVIAVFVVGLIALERRRGDEVEPRGAGQRRGDRAAIQRHAAKPPVGLSDDVAIRTEQAQEVLGVLRAGRQRRLPVHDVDRRQGQRRLIEQLLVEAGVELLAQPDVDGAAEKRHGHRQQHRVPERQPPTHR